MPDIVTPQQLEGRPGLVRSLVLSLAALAVPVAGVLWFPRELADYAALAWLLAVIPALLLAHERGWRGAATALAFGMAVLTVTYVTAELRGREIPDLLAGVVILYIVITLGIGWLAERAGTLRLTQVADLALIDTLTGLPNREQSERFLEKEFAAARLGRPLSVVRFELDRFTEFNARHGKAAGNGVLRAFATLLRQNTRRMNLSARYDTEQFLCVLSGTGEEGAATFGQRVLEQLRAAATMATLPTVSAGIACYRPGMESHDDLLAASAEALVEAKADGGDRIRLHGWKITDSGLEPLTPAPVTGEGMVQVAAEAARVRALDEEAVRTGKGRSAFVFCRNPQLRRRIAGELANEGFHVTEGRTDADSALPMNAEFDVVVADLPPSPEAFRDLAREIRRRFPATRMVGVPLVRNRQIVTSALEARADGYVLSNEAGVRFAPTLAELLSEADLRRRMSLQTRQLTDEVRARDRAARLALEASEARYQSVVRSVQEVIFRTDAAGAWAYLNPAWTAITGYPVDDSIGRDALAHIHAEDHGRLRERFQALLSGRASYLREEVRCIARDGEIRWLEVRAQPLGDAPGLPAGASGTLTDVTERYHAEAALLRSEAYYRSLIDNSSDIMAVLDSAGTIRFVSPAVRRICGYAPAELVGSAFLELIHRSDVGETGDAIAGVLRSAGTSSTVDVRVRHRNGTARWLEMSLVNLMAEPGVDGIVVNARDITDRRDAELALRESEELLHRTRKMDAIARLAGGVAHDFNNLLFTIQGHADLLLNALAAGDSKRADVEQIQDAARRAATLTRQLLAFGRRQVMQPRNFHLDEIIADLERIVPRMLGDDIDLHCRRGADPDLVHADPAQIEQALLNLVVNARDAMPHGGKLAIVTGNARVTGDSAPLPDAVEPGDYVVLTIADSGKGMDADTLARVFDPFFTTKEQAAGAGLGLSTVYGIVKQSGGHIWARSRTRADDSGTTFTIYLPVAHAGVASPDAPVQSRPARAGETIVVVEDEQSVRDLAARILTAKGYRVVTAEDSRSALDLIAKYPERIDLLLTDVVMPGMNGRELAEHAATLRPGLLVLYMSGYPGDTILPHGVLPDTTLLPKPFSHDDLLRKVRAVLDAGVRAESTAHSEDQP
jgi:diguanylate cyclase (GGDEF)-like protein/PAS domain S-box-containing protein